MVMIKQTQNDHPTALKYSHISKVKVTMFDYTCISDYLLGTTVTVMLITEYSCLFPFVKTWGH